MKKKYPTVIFKFSNYLKKEFKRIQKDSKEFKRVQESSRGFKRINQLIDS